MTIRELIDKLSTLYGVSIVYDPRSNGFVISLIHQEKKT